MTMFVPHTGSTGKALEPQMKLPGWKANSQQPRSPPSPQFRGFISTLVEELCLNLQRSLYSKFFGHWQSLVNKVKILLLMKNPRGHTCSFRTIPPLSHFHRPSRAPAFSDIAACLTSVLAHSPGFTLFVISESADLPILS